MQYDKMKFKCQNFLLKNFPPSRKGVFPYFHYFGLSGKFMRSGTFDAHSIK